ncbi:MAG: heme exporter protein CcmD [Betaproteobacteria bacterium]
MDRIDARRPNGRGMSEFLSMGGYGMFVWGSYGVTAIALAIELLAVRARRRAAIQTSANAGDTR